MIVRLTALLALALAFQTPATAQELEGDYLYKVSTVRAATGELSNLLDWIAVLKGSEYFADAGKTPPFVMRHSQGDQWDLLIITPMESWTSYFSEAAARKREDAALKHVELLAPVKKMLAFAEDHFAYGPTLSTLAAAYGDNGFYHIEMFEAAPGKADSLFEQRRIENAYLAATGQTANMIFRRAAGSDIDVFTIGFHESLEAFAAPGTVTDEEKEAAAKAAGFKGRSDISFYLRSLISGHHDTLAVKVE
jgi:hypothetical protein